MQDTPDFWEGILSSDASIANFDRQDTTVFGTLGSYMCMLHIIGKTAYYARVLYKQTSSMWMPRKYYIYYELNLRFKATTPKEHYKQLWFIDS